MMLKDIKRRETLRKFAPDRIKLKCLKSNSILPKPIKVKDILWIKQTIFLIQLFFEGNCQ